MKQNFLIIVALFGHGVCADLAHTHAVAVALGGDEYGIPRDRYGKVGGVQIEKGADLSAGKFHPADLNDIHTVRVKPRYLADGFCDVVFGNGGLLILFANGFGKLLAGKGDGTLIARCILLPCALYLSLIHI